MIPPFNTLEPLAGHPELREVNGSWMSEAQYTAEGWFVIREYTRDDGKTVRYWACSLEGIRKYGQMKQQRRSAWQARRDAEDEYSDSITELIEQRDKEGSE
jgi:hypothetical protein